MYIIDMPLSNKYQIIVKNGLIDNLGEEVQKVYSNKNIYIITDKRVAAYYLDRVCDALHMYTIKTVIIEGYEESKSLECYAKVCEKLINSGAVRGEMLVALGGGVIGDLVGFIAATLYRGMPFIQIPTSLLAQVDSSIGGKTGIDFIGHKNILGAFNQPKLVLIDPGVLKTLPIRQLKNGYAEMIKHALIASDELFDLLLDSKLNVTEEIIYHNLMIKRHFVLADEFDKNERMKLNFGHTFGHIIELEEKLLHGEAVIEGMLCAIDYAIELKMIDSTVRTKVLQLYNLLELNYEERNYRDYLEKTRFDKKNIAKVVNFILIDKIGNAIIHPVKEEDLV
jgi:3-dehydroquinate synthase